MKENFHNNLPIWISAGKMIAVASNLKADRNFRTVGCDSRREIANGKGIDTEEVANNSK